MKPRQNQRRLVAIALLLGTANIAVYGLTQVPNDFGGLREHVIQAYAWAINRHLAPAMPGMAYQTELPIEIAAGDTP